MYSLLYVCRNKNFFRCWYTCWQLICPCLWFISQNVSAHHQWFLVGDILYCVNACLILWLYLGSLIRSTVQTVKENGNSQNWMTVPNSSFLFFRYNLLFYVNPQFYGYSAITKVLLKDVHLNCEYESKLNCISTDGNAVLAKFNFDPVNPYGHLVVSRIFSVCPYSSVRVLSILPLPPPPPPPPFLWF